MPSNEDGAWAWYAYIAVLWVSSLSDLEGWGGANRHHLGHKTGLDLNVTILCLSVDISPEHVPRVRTCAQTATPSPLYIRLSHLILSCPFLL